MALSPKWQGANCHAWSFPMWPYLAPENLQLTSHWLLIHVWDQPRLQSHLAELSPIANLQNQEFKKLSRHSILGWLVIQQSIPDGLHTFIHVCFYFITMKIDNAKSYKYQEVNPYLILASNFFVGTNPYQERKQCATRWLAISLILYVPSHSQLRLYSQLYR